MGEKLTEIFQRVKYSETDLNERIWQKILSRNRKIARLKLIGFGTLGISSLFSILFALKTLFSNLSNSGAYEYISLAFSDNNLILYWKESILSIVESLPLLNILLSLSLFYLLFLSLRQISKQIINNNLSLAH